MSSRLGLQRPGGRRRHPLPFPRSYRPLVPLLPASLSPAGCKTRAREARRQHLDFTSLGPHSSTRPRSTVTEALGSANVACGPPDTMPPTAPGVTLVPPVVLGPDVTLAPDVCLGPYAVLGAGCRLASGAVVRDSVLWEGVQVGAGAQVSGCALAMGIQVPAASTMVKEVLARNRLASP